MTARGFVTRALRLLGVVASGEQPKADELADGLTALDAMFGAWRTDEATVYHTPAETVTLTPGVAAYTIGPGGDLDRPLTPHAIRSASVQLGSPAIEYPVRVVPEQPWREIRWRIGVGFPRVVFLERSAPLATLHVWRTPDAAYPLTLWIPTPLEPPAGDPDWVMDLPDGYEEAIVYNLARRLMLEFVVPPQTRAEVKELARDSFGVIARRNLDPPEIELDTLLRQPRNGRFNIISGQVE